MSLQTWQETLIQSNVDGAAVTNTTTPTSILGGTGTGASQAKLTLPANFLYVGRVMKVTAMGRISTVVTTPGTLTLDVRFGAVIVANGGAMSLNIVAKTNVPWWLEWILTCRAIGSGTTSNMMHQGMWTSEAVIGAPLPSAGGASSHLLPNAAPAVGTGFDATAAQTMDLFGTWSVANAANSILTHQYKVEALN
jgi:hypothetical protein